MTQMLGLVRIQIAKCWLTQTTMSSLFCTYTYAMQAVVLAYGGIGDVLACS